MTSLPTMLWFLALSTFVCLLAEAQHSLPVAGQTAFDEIVVESTLFVKGKTGTGRQGKAQTLESVSTQSSSQLDDRPKRDAQLYRKAKNSLASDEVAAGNHPATTNEQRLAATGAVQNTSSKLRASSEEIDTAAGNANSLRGFFSDHQFS